MTPHRPVKFPARQRGVSTLLIAMLLLAILTVVTVLATSFGMFEQRTSANEYRYKLAFQSAEAGMNQAIEYVKVNTKRMLSTSGTGWFAAGSTRWEPCSTPATGMALDPCLTEPDAGRRSNMYRYVGGSGASKGVLPLSEALGGASQTFTSTGDGRFTTQYNTYATLCRFELDAATPTCSLAPSTEGTFFLTLVSRGSLPNENATATIKQSFGTFRLLGGQPAAPLIAAGTAVGLGNAQIIPNPNAGGYSVPVSVWARGNADVSSGASFATCHLGEWLSNYGVASPPTPQNIKDGVCLNCTCNGMCPGYGLMSGNASSCQGAPTNNLEGEDILDSDGHLSDARLRDHQYFPDDLFAYIFGVPSSSAESYLEQNATKITDCSTLGPGSSGLYWFDADGGTCSLPNSTVVGSVENPVVLVSDSPMTKQGNDPVYGMMFVRSTAGTGSVFTATGGAHFYGAVILEGGANLGGSPTIVYNKAVLNNIFNSPSFVRYGPIPGSWSDDVGL